VSWKTHFLVDGEHWTERSDVEESESAKGLDAWVPNIYSNSAPGPFKGTRAAITRLDDS